VCLMFGCPVCLSVAELGGWVSSGVFVWLDATGLSPGLPRCVCEPPIGMPVHIGAFYIAGRKSGWVVDGRRRRELGAGGTDGEGSCGWVMDWDE
jgi:hypothetical protein